VFFVKPWTLFDYKMNATSIKEGFQCLCNNPHHVNILMKKVRLLVKISKNIYGKRKKHIS
jgi:hypothetical protein